VTFTLMTITCWPLPDDVNYDDLNLMTLTLMILTCWVLTLTWCISLMDIASIHFPYSFGYHCKNLILGSQQYRAWLDYIDDQAGLALCWWQRPITFDSSRLRVNIHVITLIKIVSYDLYTMAWFINTCIINNT
jgi:hypothetical protein